MSSKNLWIKNANKPKNRLRALFTQIINTFFIIPNIYSGAQREKKVIAMLIQELFGANIARTHCTKFALVTNLF